MSFEARFVNRTVRSWLARHRFGASVSLAVAAALLALSTSFAQIIGKTDLNVERHGHSATELADGKILIVGGENASGPLSASEIFDPATGHSTLGASLIVARAAHTATRLGDG